MPTGYTQKLYQGDAQTFEEFVIACAHAFIVDMRDMSIGSPIPERVVPDCYYRRLEDAEKEAAEIDRWDHDRWTQERDKAYAEHVAYVTRAKEEARELRERYEGMLAQVRAWDPPTPEHVGLHEFMIEQLSGSIKHDVYEPADPPETAWEWKSVMEYGREVSERVRRSVEWARDDLAKQERIARHNTEWVSALRDSLGVTA